jgi:hypothetical protein
VDYINKACFLKFLREALNARREWPVDLSHGFGHAVAPYQRCTTLRCAVVRVPGKTYFGEFDVAAGFSATERDKKLLLDLNFSNGVLTGRPRPSVWASRQFLVRYFVGE